MIERPEPIELDARERLTLADAIDAYRSVRTSDADWLRVPFAERFSPADLDCLRRHLLRGVPCLGCGDEADPRAGTSRPLCLPCAELRSCDTCERVEDAGTGSGHDDGRCSVCDPPRFCRWCERSLVHEDGRWIDPAADGDDITWRETCDAHDTFTAEHEPTEETDR